MTGEPGIGKSRLALELGRRVRAEGYAVASARAYAAAGRLPWGPVVDLLRADAIRSHIDTLDALCRAELARLLPELRDASRPSEQGPSGDVAQRHRLFDAVSQALVAGERPRLLIIDDLQWCDAETIELIGFVIRCGPRAPVLIVGTVRWEEFPPHHPLVGLVDALGHDRAVTTVALERLDEATTATLAARLRAEVAAVSALEEAVAMFRRALELDLRIGLGSPLVALDGYGSKGAHQLYERAISLCRKLHRPAAAPILRGLGLARLQGCRFDDCDELAPRLAALLADADRLWQRFSDRYLMVVLKALRGWLDVCGGAADGIEQIVRSVAASRSEGENLHLSYTLLLLARARAGSGLAGASGAPILGGAISR